MFEGCGITKTCSSEEFTASGGFGIFVVVVLIVVIGVGYWKGQQNQKEYGRVEKVAPPLSVQDLDFVKEAKLAFPFNTNGSANTNTNINGSDANSNVAFAGTSGNTNAVLETGTPPPEPAATTAVTSAARTVVRFTNCWYLVSQS